MPALRVHVAHVVDLRAEKEMLGVHAPAIAAEVVYLQAFGDQPDEQLVRDAVGAHVAREVSAERLVEATTESEVI